MRVPTRTLAILIVLIAFLVNGPAGYAQLPEAAETQIKWDRLHLRAAEWKQWSKTSSRLRTDNVVQLRTGATQGRVRSAPLELPFTVNGVGPHWNATVPEGTAVDVELRTSSNGTDWSAWVPSGHRTPIPAMTEGAQKANAYAGDISAGLILTEPDVRYVQVRLTLRGSSDASPSLRRLTLYVVNSTDGPRRSGEKNSRMRPMAESPDTLKPDMYTREQWGARAPTADYRYHPATHLAIHHTATTSAGAADTWKDCAAAVRAIQNYHMDTNGWIDIGYNYLICQTGAIFQGREDENDRRDVVGAHDGYNEASVGAGGLGYFHPPENEQPRSALLESYTDLFAWIAARRDIDPEGRRRYYEYGLLRTVYGHRDVDATACPGDHLYADRSTIAERVADLVPIPPATTTLSPNFPNPATLKTHFKLELSTGGEVTLTVYDLLGRRVAHRHYGYHDPGTYTVSLRTARWASGTYPYRLVVDEQFRTGTIRVVR